MPDKTNNNVNDMDQSTQSEHQRSGLSDNDTYRRTMTGYDSTKQDENFNNTEKAGGPKTIDERDPNDGDANQENNF